MAAPTHPFDIAIQAGIDLGLIEDNLRLSYEERVLQHQDALNRMLAIEQAKRERRKRLAAYAARDFRTDRVLRAAQPRSP